MRAVTFEDGRARAREDYPKPVRGPGEALVRVSVAGICNTDIEILRGYMSFSGVMGHEFVGVVEEADTKALVGRRVVGEINCPCGTCPLCEMDLGRHCRKRTVLGIQGRDGAFAEYLTLPETNLHFVSDSTADEAAVFAEPVAAAFRILDEAPLQRSDRCAVLGDGKLGLLVAQVLHPRARVTLIGHNQGKLAVAKSLGITAHTEEGFAEKDFDVVIDCTGSAGGFKAALAMLRPQGTLVVKTTVAGEVPVPMWQVVVDEIKIIGSRCGPFEPALKALHNDAVRVEPLVSARYALTDFDAAIAKAREKDSLKILLYPSGEAWK
jgi:threonine dehydrogenase-like Zn-dependent dehydrogenase